MRRQSTPLIFVLVICLSFSFAEAKGHNNKKKNGHCSSQPSAIRIVSHSIEPTLIDPGATNAGINFTFSARPIGGFPKGKRIEKKYFIDYTVAIESSSGAVVREFDGQIEVIEPEKGDCKVKTYKWCHSGKKKFKKLLKCVFRKLAHWKNGVEIPVAIAWDGLSSNETALVDSGIYKAKLKATFTRETSVWFKKNKPPKVFAKEIGRICKALGQITVGLKLAVTQPSEGAIFATKNVPVSGTVNSSSCLVTVNGHVTQRDGRNFSSDAVFSSDGLQTIEIVASDGISTAQATISITIDSTPPVINVLEPAAANFITNQNPISASCIVQDLTEVEVYIDGYQTLLEDGKYTYPVVLSEGESKTIEFKAVDAAGNESVVVVEGIVLDTTPPTATIVAPNVTNQAKLTISGSFVEAVGIETITVNGQSALIEGNSYSASIVLQEGSQLVSVELKDKAGNVGTARKTVVLDTISPVLSNIGPSSDVYITVGQATITGSVSETAAVKVGDVNAVVENGSFSATVSLPSCGSHQFQIVATDLAGNSSTVSHTLKRDSLAPNVGSLPGNGYTIIDTSPTIKIIFSDSCSGVQTSSLVIRIDGVERTSEFTVGPQEASLLVEGMEAGPHSIGAELSDVAGNTRQYFAVFTIVSYEDDNTYPTIVGVDKMGFPRFNPFYNPYDKPENRLLKIPIKVSKPANVNLVVKTTGGNTVSNRSFPYLPSGDNEIVWDGKTDDQRQLKPDDYRVEVWAVDHEGRRSVTYSFYTRIYF